MKPQYLRQREIDKIKWDECIKNAPNERIYAYSWYLDAVAENWDAWVWGDYAAVMPLPWKSKFGLKYVYMPPFCQQLGVFGHVAEIFIPDYVPFHFIKVSYCMPSITGIFRPTVRTNQILILDKDYTDLKNNYRENHLRSIQKALKNEAELISYTPNATDFTFVFDLYSSLGFHYRQSFYARYVNTLLNTKNILAHTVKVKNAVCGTLITAEVNTRIYILMGGCNYIGKKNKANHLLYDQVIRHNAGKKKWLDFEGSSIPTVHFFNQCFGAIDEPYYHLSFNQLWGFKW